MILYTTYCSGNKYPIKRGRPKELYDSNRVKAFIRYCEFHGLRYGVVSAKYGVVFSDEAIDNYDVLLKNLSPLELDLLKTNLQAKLDGIDEVVFWMPNQRGNRYWKLVSSLTVKTTLCKGPLSLLLSHQTSTLV